MAGNPLFALREGLIAEANEEDYAIDGEAIRKLAAGLKEAVAYQGLPVDRRDWWAGQRALLAVIKFLQSHDRLKAGATPLVNLQAALLDLDNGHVAPLLRPRPVAGGRPTSLNEANRRGYAAGIMGGLMHHAAMPKEQAAQWVSKRLRAAGHDVAATTITEWRTQANNYRRFPALSRAYGVCLRQADWSADPLARAEALAVKLISLLPSPPKKKG
jgi:hypothetical protein